MGDASNEKRASSRRVKSRCATALERARAAGPHQPRPATGNGTWPAARSVEKDAALFGYVGPGDDASWRENRSHPEDHPGRGLARERPS